MILLGEFAFWTFRHNDARSEWKEEITTKQFRFNFIVENVVKMNIVFLLGNHLPVISGCDSVKWWKQVHLLAYYNSAISSPSAVPVNAKNND
jgi:hypothetical protein